MDLTTLTKRDDLGWWLNSQGLVGTGIEVGTLYGEFMETIMNKWNGKEIYCIDPWEKQPEGVYREPVNNSDWHEIYRGAQYRAGLFGNRVELIIGYSPEISRMFGDGTQDFVYLDGRHDLEAVRADLKAWYPKVKKGGLFSGHDFRLEKNETQCCEVKPAVEEWCKEMGIGFPYVTNYPGCQSWWIEKK